MYDHFQKMRQLANWAIPVNRCTPPRRSNLISLRGIKMACLINSLGVKQLFNEISRGKNCFLIKS